MENKLPTAKELLLQENDDNPLGTVWTDAAVDAMIEFAKLHVKAALEAKADEIRHIMQDSYTEAEIEIIAENTKSYPLTNIN